MKSVSIIIPIVVLALSVSSTVADFDDEECPHAGDCPSVRLSVAAACRKACATDLLHRMCMEMLHGSPDNETTAYAREAIQRALRGYYETTYFVKSLLRDNSSIVGEERDALYSCLKAYDAPSDPLLELSQRLSPVPTCFRIIGSYRYVKGAVYYNMEACRARVAKLPTPSPVLAKVKDDINWTLLAYSLGKLLGVK